MSSSADDSDGYCPIPDQKTLKDNIDWSRQMWIGDNCHTYDRADFEAQLECGVGKNNPILSNLTVLSFEVEWWPYIQDEKNRNCMLDFIP